jgi:hypothetical protein
MLLQQDLECREVELPLRVQSPRVPLEAVGDPRIVNDLNLLDQPVQTQPDRRVTDAVVGG